MVKAPLTTLDGSLIFEMIDEAEASTRLFNMVRKIRLLQAALLEKEQTQLLREFARRERARNFGVYGGLAGSRPIREARESLPAGAGRPLLIAAARVVAQHSHSTCGRYAVDPDPTCCPLCDLEYELRQACPAYGESQKYSSLTSTIHKSMSEILQLALKSKS